VETHDTRPTLKAVIIDFSSVNNVDITSVQVLIDVRNELDRYASPDKVQWHFAAINNRWTKRALASAGFGYPTPDRDPAHETRWKPIFSVAELGGSNGAAQYADYSESEEVKRQKTSDLEAGNDQIKAAYLTESSDNFEQVLSRNDKLRVAVVNGLNRPFFHTDLTSALRSTIENIEAGHGVVSEATLATALDLQEH
jgi:sodium-independent sulfate anion transporter 11